MFSPLCTAAQLLPLTSNPPAAAASQNCRAGNAQHDGTALPGPWAQAALSSSNNTLLLSKHSPAACYNPTWKRKGCRRHQEQTCTCRYCPAVGSSCHKYSSLFSPAFLSSRTFLAQSWDVEHSRCSRWASHCTWHEFCGGTKKNTTRIAQNLLAVIAG